MSFCSNLLLSDRKFALVYAANRVSIAIATKARSCGYGTRPGALEFYGPLAGGVALHGLVDCLTPTRLLCYLPALIPLEGTPLSVGFVAASFIHVSADLSVLVSMIVHAMIGGFVFLEAREGATAILLSYMWLVHMPNAYRAAAAGHALSFAVIALSIAFGAYGGTPLLTHLKMIEHDKEQKSIKLVIPPLAQRVVVCHVVANLLLG